MFGQYTVSNAKDNLNLGCGQPGPEFMEKALELFNESRDLYNKGIIDLYGEDLELINTNIGQTGIYEGEEVYLDMPFIENEEEHLVEAKHRGKNVKLNKPFRTPGGPKKFAVYVKSKGGNVPLAFSGHSIKQNPGTSKYSANPASCHSNGSRMRYRSK